MSRYLISLVINGYEERYPLIARPTDVVVVISFLICSRYKRAHATSSYGARPADETMDNVFSALGGDSAAGAAKIQGLPNQISVDRTYLLLTSLLSQNPYVASLCYTLDEGVPHHRRTQTEPGEPQRGGVWEDTSSSM